MKNTTLIPALVAMMLSASAFAQSAVSTETQRDVNQQQRIENGLKSGELTTREAAKLEKQEAKVDRAEARAAKDGVVTDAEKAKIASMQNKVSADIKAEKHDGQVGNPDSASSRRLQADVQRNVNQEKRIENGVQSGSLTTKEAGKLERGQSKVDAKEGAAGANGKISAREQRRLQHAENHQSHRIFRHKHNQQSVG